MRLQVIKNRIYYWFRKIFLYTAFIVLATFTLAFLAFQFPQVQTALLHRYLSGFSQIVGFPTTVEEAELRWYDRLHLKNVKIIDPEKNTMISVQELAINFEFLELLRSGGVRIDGAVIDRAVVHLKKIPESASDSTTNLNINLFIRAINEKLSSGKGGASSAKLLIGEISLNRSQFIYDEADRDTITSGFDYRHFHLDVDDGELAAFEVIGDTIQFDLQSLHIVDRKTQFTISEFSTFFRISQASMEFLNTNLHAGHSIIGDSIRFFYKSQDDLSDFNDKVTIDARLKDTSLDPDDLELFTYGLPRLPQSLSLAGHVQGKVSRFVFSPMAVSFGQTHIQGRLQMDGLPNINETFIDLNIRDGVIDQPDIHFMLRESSYQALLPLGRTRATVEFTGFPNDFVARGNLATQLGRIISDVNLKINENDETRSVFSGNLELNKFELGRYLKDTVTYQQVSLRGRVNGTGLTRETTDFTLAGTITSLGFRHYDYKGITTNARFARQLFNGQLSIDDPNLQFNATAFIDFRKGKDIIQVKANLDTALLDQLGFVSEPLSIRSNFDIDTRGLQLDSLVGNVVLRQTTVGYRDRQLFLDSIHLISERQRNEHHASLQSSVADLDLRGDFRYAQLTADLTNFWKAFQSKFMGERQSVAFSAPADYSAQLKILFRNITPLAQLAHTKLRFSPGATLTGHFGGHETQTLTLQAHADTIDYAGKLFSANDILLAASRQRDSSDVQATLEVLSGRQQLSNYFQSGNLRTDVYWRDNRITIGFNADQIGNSNRLRLKTQLDLMQDSLAASITSSELSIFDEPWTFDGRNRAVMKPDGWHFSHVGISHNEESAEINGAISENPDVPITLVIRKFNLDILNTLLQEKISGVVDGQVEGRDLYHDPFIQNNLLIKNLTVDDFLVGDVSGKNQWNRDQRRFDLNLFLDRDKLRTVEMTGYYDPATDVPLNVKAKLENTNIKIIEPFLRGIFSKLDGKLTGNYTITGSFLSPVINGEGKIENGTLTVDYLKTKYFFNGGLNFTPRNITFAGFRMTDELSNKGRLEGSLLHDNYRGFRIDLKSTFEKFQMLNTTAKDNSLFYGQAYATGDMTMTGPLENLKISATARSEKGTRIFIPLNGSVDNTAEKKDFISFSRLADSVQQKKAKAAARSRNEPTGITMDLNLDITQDAYAEIIFDIRSGDIIRGYGNGNLKLQFDTKGEFAMFGDYVFQRGNYNFTLYDIINKEFVINQGSKISWAGDPYGAQLGINASYKQLVSFAPIVTECAACATSTAMRRKFPVEVQLKIDGAMLSPQINFDIVANGLPNNLPTEFGTVALNQSFTAFKAKLDEQELKKQVFSLIVLRRFSPQDAFATNSSGSLYSSVSELLSNQLSYWLTQVDQNLEINFDLGNFDQEAFNTFQLRLSYSFLNGRLRVTRDGAFNNQYNRSDVSNMLGDWTVDYLLTPDGTFKVKMFNRTNVNQLTSALSGSTTISTGVSLMTTKSFNHWSDLITTARERRRRELEQQQNTKPKDGTH